jgi:outer membrane protein OmpA-like peptidoglycan-associated protein
MENQQYSNLDQLLEGKGPVTSATAPILMPTDLLFEYDSDQLKPDAAQSLAKLGELIRKNGQATFRIEGYTDSFGSDDYNLGLSTRRAEAVRVWLQKNMDVDTSRITTAGMGKSRLLVPATGTVEQQQLNRRVEIVITTH